MLHSGRIEIQTVRWDLEELIKRHGTKGNTYKLYKVRRFKWTWELSDIKTLQDKLERSRKQIHLGLTEMVASCGTAQSHIPSHVTQNHATSWQRYDIVEFLIKTWNLGGVRRDHYTDRGAVLWAREFLVQADSWQLDDRQKWLLGKVAALGDDVYNRSDKGVMVLNGPQAVLQGTDTLKRLLVTDPLAVHNADDCNMTALHTACIVGDSVAVKLLIDARLPLNACDCYGRTPLIVALYNGQYFCAQLLLDTKCNIRVVDKDGYNALWFVMKEDITPTFELLKHIITEDPKGVAATQDILGRTPLHWLSKVYGPTELAEQLVTLLLQAGATLEPLDSDGITPLIHAINEDNALAVRLLLHAGANPNPPLDTKNGANILHKAATWAKLDVLDALTDAYILGVDVDEQDRDGDSPLVCWRWRRYGDEDCLLIGMTRPTAQENRAFEALLRGVRDRTFQADIDLCIEVLQAAKGEDYLRAKELIDPSPIDEGEKKDGYRGCKALRTNILLQIKSGLWDSAITELEDMIETRRHRMSKSPFQEESNRYYVDPVDDSQEGESEEDGDESEGNSEDEKYELAWGGEENADAREISSISEALNELDEFSDFLGPEATDANPDVPSTNELDILSEAAPFSKLDPDPPIMNPPTLTFGEKSHESSSKSYVATTYSDAGSLGDSKFDEYAVAFADVLSHSLSPDFSQHNLEAICNLLPTLLEAFASQIAYETHQRLQLQVKYLVHRDQLYVYTDPKVELES
ncbi:putative ankyrin repeat protein [Phaeoacremonium minimum UCRPA7]|uniref:Putative ankyrin repeat protein n=1 Tax=Phaeoacremonium minimum (strain UCR-PA7) TaxID=1286976 RepID=R8BH11_PHAM7|nr:putative ankyrin repeat protein [Phaeoacremonium minimum UCRPA7]EON98601.1 putative ankyrin repeat protein [Phaeoacremonium minimum UCRPA7]